METVEYSVGDDFQVAQMMSSDFGEGTYLKAAKRFRAVTLIRIIYSQGVPDWEEIGKWELPNV